LRILFATAGLLSAGSTPVDQNGRLIITIASLRRTSTCLEFFVNGRTPVSLEILSTGHVLNSSPPFGLEIIGEVPLIETVPGALDASFKTGTIKVGAAYKQGKKTISYVTLPKRCPKGGLPVKVELSFLGGATAVTSYKMPCPRI
jgi:hypothetical protein